MSLEKYLEEALRLVRYSQHYVSMCLCRKYGCPTAEDIALMGTLKDAYQEAYRHAECAEKVMKAKNPLKPLP